MRLEAQIGGKPQIIELDDGATPEQIDEVLSHASAQNPSLGSKIGRDALTALKNSANTEANVLDVGANYGDFITNVAGDILGSAAGPEAVAVVDSAKQWIGDSMFGRAANKVAENTPEAVSVPMRIVAPALAAGGVRDIVRPVAGGAKKLSAKLGTGSANTFPNGLMSKTAPNMVRGAKFPDTEEIMAMQNAGNDAVSEAYQGINATLRPEAEQALKGDILKQIGSLQINPAASPKTIGAVKALYDRITKGKINPITGEAIQAPLTVPEVDGFRRLLGNTAGEDAAAAGKMRSSIDNFLNKLDENSFLEGGPHAVEKLNNARAIAAQNFKMQKFSEMVKSADGNPNKIQKAAFNFLKDKDNLAGLDPESIAALKAVRDGTGTQKALQFLGRLGFDQDSAWGPAVLGFIGGAPITIPATAARYGNKLAVRGVADKALRTLAEKRIKPRAPIDDNPIKLTPKENPADILNKPKPPAASDFNPGKPTGSFYKDYTRPTPRDTAYLDGLIQDLEASTTGNRIFLDADRQGGTANVIGNKSTFPKWFQQLNKNGEAVGTVQLKRIVAKMKSGTPLGKKEIRLAQAMHAEVRALREENARQYLNIRDAKKLENEQMLEDFKNREEQ